MLRSAHIRFTYSYNEYSRFLTHREAERLEELARQLFGKRIMHINATDTGGGIAEILQSLVPFEQSLQIKSMWRVLTVKRPFFSITKKIHHALQGSRTILGTDSISEGEWQFYLEHSKDIAHAIAGLHADILIIHDPQPLVAGYLAEISAKKVLRIHIDMSSPDKEILSRFVPYFKKYERLVFSLPSYIATGYETEQIAIISPSINPLSEKNKPMKRVYARHMLSRFGVRGDSFLIAQVSRFDVWKDPIGVIQAFHMAQKTIPNSQLVLLGSIDIADDPEAAGIVKEIRVYTEKDPSVIIISEESDQLVNAVQTAADVVLQKSLREGFGLTATEAMWKARPVVAGNVGGLRAQIQDGENGFLVNSVEEAAIRVEELFRNERLRRELGEHAHESVRERFLLPREALDHLQLYADILGV